MVLTNMEDYNKRFLFARLRFGGKERLRETKQGGGESAQGLLSFLIVSRVWIDE